MDIQKKSIFESAQEVAQFFAPLRKEGKKIVTTNGCFDILHAGHVRYLTEAASKGDFLIVGVNADSTVRKLKGIGRPLQAEQDRVYVLSALKVVAGAFIFHEDDPRAFLEIIKPDVHVKGGDYSSELLERETVERNGGRIEIVSFVPGKSTTSIVKKIQEKA